MNKKGVIGMGLPLAALIWVGAFVAAMVVGGIAAVGLVLKHTVYAGALGIGGRFAFGKLKAKGVFKGSKGKKR